jgi:hypothetical protein
MPSAAALRIEIERALDRRFPAALTPVPRTISETATTGVPEVDALLDGGLPVGAISEVTGPQSSGRTGLALSFLAQQTQDERVCAWVDAGDAFDPESAAASGVSLRQLLWVCRDVSTVNAKNGSRISPGWKAKAKHPFGPGSIKRCGLPTSCFRQAGLPPLCWIWVTWRQNTGAGFRWRPGSGFVRRRIAHVVAWLCWAKQPMRNRARRSFWNARRASRTLRAAPYSMAFRLRCVVDGSVSLRLCKAHESRLHQHGPQQAHGKRRNAHER